MSEKSKRRISVALRRAVHDLGSVSQDTMCKLLNSDAPSPAGTEQRASGRMGVDIPVLLHSRNSLQKETPATVVDVGLSGLCAELGLEDIDYGPVTLELAPSFAQGTGLLQGEVRWINAGNLPVRAGISIDVECCWRWFSALKRFCEISPAGFP